MSLSTLFYAAVVVVMAGDPGSSLMSPLSVALEKKAQNSTPCTTDVECSLNGVCISSLCVCDAPWSGPGCSILAFASTPPSGKNIYNGSDPRNTWGGAFAGPGDDGKFHAYVPLYRQGSLWHVETCMYGVADSPTGPWDWSSGAAANFSCGINPQFLAFPNASNPSQTLYSLWERGAFWLSESLYGPFIAQRQGGYTGINPAPIFHNGSFFVTTQATKEIVTAPSYLGPWTHYSNITHPPTLPYIVEDPFLWIDKRGRWHIINHAYNTSEVGSCGSSHVSAHWFSADGRDWHWSPQEPYGHTVTYQDGSMHTFATMERPYLHFDASTGSPDYLVLAVDLDASGSCPLDERNRTQCCDCCKFSDHDGTTVIKLVASGPSSPGGAPPPPAGLPGYKLK